MRPGEATLREIRKIKLIGLFMWVAAPPVLILIGSFATPAGPAGPGVDMMWYMMLIIAGVSPLLLPMIESHQIRKYRQTPPTDTSLVPYLAALSIFRVRKNNQVAVSNASPAKYLTTVYMIRFAFVETGYLYGLITYYITADPARALLFAPICMIWSAVYWPREEKIMQTLKRLEAA